MEWNAKQLKSLREALMSAFTDKTKLKIMLSDYLDVRLHRIVPEENKDYEEIVFELIDWAGERNQVKELVLGAMKANSNNHDLQNFFRNNVINLLVDDENSILNKPKLVKNLISLLEQEDFELIKSAGFYALPDLQSLNDNNQQDIKDLETTSLCVLFKIFILLNMLLNEYPKKDDVLAILIFADRLYQTTQKPELQNQLKAWVQEVNQKYGFSLPQVQNTQNSQLKSNIEAYLMITVRPSTELGKFHLNAYLELPGKNIIPIDLAEDSSQKGVTISFKKNANGQAPKEIINYIKKSEKIIYQKRQEIGYKACRLKLEFFLPFECFHENIEHLKIPKFGEDFATIGERYTLIVRSYDRLNDFQLWNRLQEVWIRIKTLCDRMTTASSCQEISDELNSYFENWRIIENYNWKKLSYQLREKIGLKLACCLPTSEKDCQEIFKAIIDRGIPFAIWRRTSELPESELISYQNLMQYLTWEFFVNPNRFFDALNKERQRANTNECPEQFLGYHLGILYESDRWGQDIPLLEYISLSE